MIKFKTFFGTMNGTTAADYLNKWLEENKTVEVIDFKYQQARFGDHSICIMYREMGELKEEVCPVYKGAGMVMICSGDARRLKRCTICSGTGKVGVKND